MLKILSIPLVFLAYTLLSTGLVLMKKGIAWIGYKGKKGREYRHDLAMWISGFILINLYIVPITMALKSLHPHIVSSVAGWGVIVMVILSRLLLKEPLSRWDLPMTGLIVVSIMLLNIMENQTAPARTRLFWLAAASAIPLLAAVPASFRVLPSKIRSVGFAAVSGMSTGMIVVLMKLLVDKSGFRIAEYFSSPVFYLYMLFSITAFLALQFAYKLGGMLRVGPAQYSTGILYPVICSTLVFGNHLHIFQWAAVLLILAGVVGILRKH